MLGNKRWSLCGAPWLQRVATSRKPNSAESRLNKQKLLPSVATSCRAVRMVRRGSTVRVRQRASEKRRNRRFCMSGGLQFLQVAQVRSTFWSSQILSLLAMGQKTVGFVRLPGSSAWSAMRMLREALMRRPTMGNPPAQPLNGELQRASPNESKKAVDSSSARRSRCESTSTWRLHHSLGGGPPPMAQRAATNSSAGCAAVTAAQLVGLVL
jgi:hypothetical protein